MSSRSRPREVGDSLGGIVEVIAYGVPVGLAATCTGSQTRRTTRRRTHEHSGGEGGRDRGRILPASQRGSVAHDAIAVDDSFDQGGGYIRRTITRVARKGGSLPARRSSPR